MTKFEAEKRIKKLREIIDKYRYSRLVLDKPLIAESAEDALKKELFDLEEQYPDLVTPDSPTQRVAGRALGKFEKFKHPERMYSFNDAFDADDMDAWAGRLERLDGKAVGGGFYAELKLDGLAVELIYKDGVLSVGSTRGDGNVGENVTQNLKTIEAIPLKLTDTKKYGIPREVIVRGEVFINLKDFNRINKKQEKLGKQVYANPRNLAAGSVRQLDAGITKERKLDSFAYSLVTDLGQRKHEDEHDILKALGFKTNSHNVYCKDLGAVNSFRDKWEKDKDKLEYEVDGVVVIVNDNKIFKKLGIVGKAPRGAIAYKFSPKESTTVLEDIIISVGRTGVLTPVAVLKPVEIGGTIVSRATLHNEDEIKRLEVKIGDTVIVGRAGDVIPDVKKVIKELRTGKEKSFRFPIHCPVCGGVVARIEGEAAHKCTNKDCSARKREGLYHFVSRGALDIPGLGPKIIDQLMDAGLVKDPADLFILKKEDLLNLERFADKSAQNTIDAIESVKKMPLDRFIFALGIPHVGTETAYELASHFGSLEKLSQVSAEELASIRDVGGIVARSINNWFGSEANNKLLKKFKEVGVKVRNQKSSKKSSKFKNMTFVFTGSIESMTREDAEKLVREHGGNASSSVSKNTNYVVAGESTGSKYDKAKKLGVRIIDEKEFLKMV
ncbi:MAG: NAD-dependent DNA ligase LigA [Parcubacteria group bacterium]